MVFSTSILGQVYAVCALFGSAFIFINFFLGHLGHEGDGGGGHDATAVDHSGGSGHDFGTGDDGASAGGHDFGAGDDGGSGGGHDFDASDSSPVTTAQARANMGTYAVSSLKSSTHGSLATHQDNDILSRLGFLTLRLLSPMGIAIFFAFFGCIGLLLLRLFPILGVFSVIPAVLAAIAISNLFKTMVRLMVKHLDASSLTKVSELVGQVGEVNTPIAKGRTGEITYVVNCKRHSSPARAADGNLELQRGTKIMIVDTNEQVMLVEPYTE